MLAKAKSRINDKEQELPWGPVIKNLLSSARNTGSIPGLGTKVPHASGLCCNKDQMQPKIRFWGAALGLRCCVWTFSSCGEQGLLFVVVLGLLVVVSLFAEHGLQVCGRQ